MKNFYVKSVMVLAMIFGMSATALAQLYDNLETAQAALDKGVADAGKLGEKFMDIQVKEELSEALIEATAVWDSKRREDINEINKVMPSLLAAIEKAEKSIEEYKGLAAAIDEFEKVENDKIDELISGWDELLGDLADDDELVETILDAVDNWENQLSSTLFEVRQAGGNKSMLDAYNKGGVSIRTILADNGYVIPELKDVVQDIINNATGIVSAKAVEQGDSAEYGLNGVKVSGNYKGLVIKNGKKIIKK